MSSDAALQRAMKDAQEGKLASALATLRVMVRARPKDFAAVHVLGMLLEQSGDIAQGLHHLARSVDGEPGAPSYRNNFANALLAAGHPQEAVAQWRKALELDPAYIAAYLGLTLAHAAAGEGAKAIEAGRKGLAIKPDWPRLAHNLANALEDSGRMQEAYELLRDTQAKHPTDAVISSRLLQASNYLDLPCETIAKIHRDYARCVAPRNPSARTDPNPDRSLRVGILSGDLRTHSVAYFIEPIIRHAPADTRLTVISTGTAKTSDAMRATLKSISPEWVDGNGVSDATLDQLIREREIDVLVECGGHTSGGRLGALDNSPAPVIVTAIGYPNTTGHPMVGWRIVDSITDPPENDALCTEKLLRIDPCFLCYTPPAQAPSGLMPGDAHAICFGSFNLASKISPRTITMWAAAMAAVPRSRLLLKSKSISDPDLRASLMKRFNAAGIASERIECIDYTQDLRDHLACYSRVHIALDTAPYNGTTTTCEALWMGVPVITLEGDHHAARVGASLLSSCGRREWVASSSDEFVGIARKLASDIDSLARMRTTLREELSRSPLCDAPAYARRFHGALRDAWRAWCAANS